MRAIEFHIEGFKEDGEPFPEPASSIEFIEVAAYIRMQMDTLLLASVTAICR